MNSAPFRRNETEALVGKSFEILVELPHVPTGSRGRVLKVDHPNGSNIFIIAIDWELDETGGAKTIRASLTLS